jgi:hypothetical protein
LGLSSAGIRVQRTKATARDAVASAGRMPALHIAPCCCIALSEVGKAENRGQAFGLRFTRFASVSRHPPAPARRDGALPAGVDASGPPNAPARSAALWTAAVVCQGDKTGPPSIVLRRRRWGDEPVASPVADCWLLVLAARKSEDSSLRVERQKPGRARVRARARVVDSAARRDLILCDAFERRPRLFRARARARTRARLLTATNPATRHPQRTTLNRPPPAKRYCAPVTVG